MVNNRDREPTPRARSDDASTNPFDGVLAFLRVAESLSFRRSADVLGVTPAAVSRTIQRLEERVNARLLERTTRSVRLTTEGAAFAARCREAYAQMRIAEGELSIARSAVHGTLAVSSSQILAPLVAPALARFVTRHPNLRADLRLSDRVIRFAEEEVDVAIRVGKVEDQDLVAHALLKPRWITVASPAYLALRGTPRTPDDLSTHACIHFVPPRGKPRLWTFASSKDAVLRTIATTGPIDVDRGDMLVTCAIADAGIVQVLDFMVAHDLREGRLVDVFPDYTSGSVPISAVHPSSRRSLPRLRAFVAFLRDELGRF